MEYCNKCGTLLEDVSKPCPTCGMTLNQINRGSDNNVTSREYLLNIGIAIVVLLSVVFIGGFIGSSYLSGDETYETSNYTFKYDKSIWGLSGYTNSSYVILSYVGIDGVYLQVPIDTIRIGTSLDLDDSEQREIAYKSLVASITGSTDIEFTNIMSSIEPLSDTDYYYFSTNFASYIDEDTIGKLYIVINSSGESVLFYVYAENSDVVKVEDDVLNILKSLEIK